MKVSIRALAFASLLALLVGLVLGVAVGRSRAPFDLATVGAQDANGEFGLAANPVPAISVSDLRQLLEGSTPVTVVDVREPGKYAASHLVNALSIPLGTIWARQNEIPRDRLVVVYCDESLPGEIAALELREFGWSNVRHLEGDLPAWRAAGLIVVK